MMRRETLVPLDEKPALAAMMQDYIADMALLIPGVRPGQAYPDFDLFWSAPDSHWPFWIGLGDARAGFALVDRDAGTMHMAEFFIARRYRRNGVGLSAARRLIARFPGAWSIAQRQTNEPAILFWHRVLDGFVDYAERTTATDAVRVEQRFTIA